MLFSLSFFIKVIDFETTNYCRQPTIKFPNFDERFPLITQANSQVCFK